MSSYRIATVLFAALIFSVSGTARAAGGDKNEARKRFDVATRLYEVEDYKGAVTEFEASVKLYPTKNGYFNLANCYKALHRYEDALTAIDQLESRFDKTLDKTMRRKVDELRSLIDTLVGELTIYVAPMRAEVRVNGKALSSTRFGSPLKLGPGEYRIDAALPGFEAVSKKVTVYSQKKQNLRITLVPQTGMLVVETDVSGATVVVDGELQGETPLSINLPVGEHLLEVSLKGYAETSRTLELTPNAKTTVTLELGQTGQTETVVERDKRQKLFPTLKIVGIAGTATTAVLSGVFYGLAAKNASDFKTYDDNFVNAPNAAAAKTADEDRLDAKQKTEQFAAFGLAFGITAGVLCASTIAVVVLSKMNEKPTETAAVSIEGGSLTVRF